MTTTADLRAYLDAHGIDGSLPDADVRVEVYQHRSGDNRTAEGVIVVHIPTGTRAECHKHKSPHRNRAAAMARLGELLRDDLRGLEEKAEHDRT
jgi:protein subunit release factor A